MDTDWQQLLLALSPQAAYGDQEKAIQEQLAQAYALRNRQQSQHTTGAGAALGGMGDILNTVTGKQQASQLQAQQQQMQQAYIKAIQDAIRAQQQPQAASGFMPMPGGPVGGP